MKFQESQPIFMQIVDWMCDKVLRHELEPDQQIPSVREIAVELEVNPNTVMRSIERLLQAEIIYSQRGKGNYLAADAYQRILQMRSERLMNDTLPQLIAEMKLLGISEKDLLDRLASIQPKL